MTIKLDNGYNASYTLDEIQSIEIIGKIREDLANETSDVSFDDKLPRVRIIHTGGTIASKVDYKTGAVVAKFEPENLLVLSQNLLRLPISMLSS